MYILSSFITFNSYFLITKMFIFYFYFYFACYVIKITDAFQPKFLVNIDFTLVLNWFNKLYWKTVMGLRLSGQ